MSADLSSEHESSTMLRVLPKVVLSMALLAGAGATYRVVSTTPSSEASLSLRALEDYGPVPEFTFEDQRGVAFGNQNMLGHVSIANFIFTRCPTICPVFTTKMKRISEQTSSQIQFISFSVDPEYDTPERLAEYARAHGIDSERWHFLTGDHNKIKDTVEGALKIAMERGADDDTGVPDIVHGSHFVLFDGEGRIRGYYNSDDAERIQTLIRDAETLTQ